MGPYLTHRPSHRAPYKGVDGFTIIEMLIALAIVGVIMAIAIAGNSSFNKSILLSQAAYAVGTTIRETQSLGIANRSMDMNMGYGFNVFLEFGGAGATEYRVFADTSPSVGSASSERCYPNENPQLPNAKPGDCLYNSSYDTLVSTYSMQRGIAITAFCGTRSDNLVICTQITDQSQTCASSSEGGIEELSIVFSRPSTGAILRGVYYNGYVEEFVAATLAIQSPDGGTKYVTVRDTGQISVHSTCQ